MLSLFLIVAITAHCPVEIMRLKGEPQPCKFPKRDGACFLGLALLGWAMREEIQEADMIPCPFEENKAPISQ